MALKDGEEVSGRWPWRILNQHVSMYSTSHFFLFGGRPRVQGVLIDDRCSCLHGGGGILEPLLCCCCSDDTGFEEEQ